MSWGRQLRDFGEAFADTKEILLNLAPYPAQ